MKTAICAMIKDEQDYLDEWLNYHLNLGINEIYLFEDYNSISHLPITDKYGEKVKLFSIDEIFTNEKYSCSRFEPEGVVNQIKLFDWFPIVYKEEFDWVLFIDIDEFLILKYDLNKLLEEYSDKTAILLNWKWYGASGHINKPDGGVMENYTIESPSPFDKFWSRKSFLNCKNFVKWENPIHKVEGGVFPLTDWGDHKAYVNHYFTKSWEEWKTKLLSRGDTCPGNRKITHFFHFNLDLLDKKNDLLLEIAIDNAKKLGFNQNCNLNSNDSRYLHFCWFGGNKFSDLHLKCIESWKKYLSDNFIVCLWNESSFGWVDYKFARQAYDSKKWAFVSDYVRLWSVYNYGGIYLDTDVELLKPIDFLPKNFMAIEKDFDSLAFGLGFGAEKNNEIIGKLLGFYDDMEFSSDIMFDLTIPKIVTLYFYDNGYVKTLDSVHEYFGFTIYPYEYFCPKSFMSKEINITENTISIHHYDASWGDGI